MSLDVYIKQYKKIIGKNIKRSMKLGSRISQKEIVQKCKEAGYEISQATISTATRGEGNTTINNLLAIAYALNVDIKELLDAGDGIERA